MSFEQGNEQYTINKVQGMFKRQGAISKSKNILTCLLAIVHWTFLEHCTLDIEHSGAISIA